MDQIASICIVATVTLEFNFLFDPKIVLILFQ